MSDRQLSAERVIQADASTLFGNRTDPSLEHCRVRIRRESASEVAYVLSAA